MAAFCVFAEFDLLHYLTYMTAFNKGELTNRRIDQGCCIQGALAFDCRQKTTRWA